MVDSRRPNAGITRGSRHYEIPGAPTRVLPARRCRICGAILRRSRPATETTCESHGAPEVYNPRHDRLLEQRILLILTDGECHNLAAELGASDRKAIWEAVRRLRKKGKAIVGCPGSGYVLPLASEHGKMGA